ncbi:MAG: hypothetical protein KJO33_02340 [Gammaproteobacteria bacterium]|nr:hypothetical protein [Gammaproteobacteria bacterium]
MAYRYFDFCIDCDFPLPGLAKCESGEPAWRIRKVEALDEAGFDWFHEWKSESGRVVMSVARRGGDYLLDCLGQARFLTEFESRRIGAQPLGDCPDHSLAHLLLDQALPRAVCHEGRTVVHASAVRLEDGRAVAFAGPTGRGKSTLATAFHREGFEVIADDCVLLTERDGRVLAVPAYPSVRLWSDSAEELVKEDGRLVDMAHYTGKKQLLLGSEGQKPEIAGIELAGLFLLELPGESAIDIEPAGGRSVLMSLIEDTFALDVVDHNAVQRSFELAGRLARGLSIFRLSYPRDYRKLSQVIANITKFNQLPAHTTPTGT